MLPLCRSPRTFCAACRVSLLVAAAIVAATYPIRSADKRIVLIAGRPSHPPGMHEFRAGCLLLQKALSAVPGHHRAGLRRRLAGEGSGRRARRRQRRPRQRRRGVDLLRRRQRQPGDPGRARQGPRRARGQGRRPRLRALRGRSARRRAGRGDAAMDWRLSTRRTTRSTRCGSRPSTSSRTIRSRAASDRLPRTTSGTSACGGRPTRRPRRRSRPSSCRRRATRCARAPTSARAGRTTTSSPPAARPKR